MKLERREYLQKLIRKKDNSRVKIVTGIGDVFRKDAPEAGESSECRRIKGLWRNIKNQEDKALIVQWVAGRGSLSDRRARTSREGSR